MRIRISKPGIYGAKGPIPVGTELSVKEPPKGWAGRYDILSKDDSRKTPVTNPVEGAQNEGYTGDTSDRETTPEEEAAANSTGDLSVAESGSGWYVIKRGDQTLTKNLRKETVDGFDDLTDEEKQAFVEANKAN